MMMVLFINTMTLVSARGKGRWGRRDLSGWPVRVEEAVLSHLPLVRAMGLRNGSPDPPSNYFKARMYMKSS